MDENRRTITGETKSHFDKCGLCGIPAAEAEIYASGLCKKCDLAETLARNNHYKQEQQLKNLEIDIKLSEKKQKHGEIKQLAREIFVHNNCTCTPDGTWSEAEQFYDFVEKKEAENGKA